MELREYQQHALQAIKSGKHIVVAAMGSGKTITSISWAKSTHKSRVLVVTKAKVRDQMSYPTEAEQWYPDWYKSLASFEVVSWAGVAKWTQANWDSLEEYAFIFDEVDSCCAGVSSLQGSAFLQITKRTDCWTGWTGTLGEDWLHYYPYFVACGMIRNKTEFNNRFGIMGRFYKPIAYRETETLEEWRKQLIHVVDSSELEKELPPENNYTIMLDTPKGYKRVEKTSSLPDGTFLDNSSKYRHALRRMCMDKQKLDWITEWISSIKTNAVIFYTYTDSGDAIQSAVEQALGIKRQAVPGYKGERLKRPVKGQLARVWRIDGQSHEQPTAETIGPRDVVLAQWQAGARGLNLQYMNYWLCAEPYDSYGASKQAKGRIRRIGQTKPQFYYFLHSKGTVEDDIYKTLHGKGDFDGRVWALAKQHEYNIKWSNNE